MLANIFTTLLTIGLKIIAFFCILYILIGFMGIGLAILIMANEAPANATTLRLEPIQTIALPPARERRYNITEPIKNGTLITPPPATEQPRRTKKQPKSSTTTQQKPLNKMTSKELLDYAKQHKIKGYTATYKTYKKPGLLALIEEQLAA